jgi:hypothetical protein
MRSNDTGSRRRPCGSVAVFTIAVLAAASACSGGDVRDEAPPESVYTEAEAFAPMEAEVADIVAALPEFPGFESRSWNELPCAHNGVDDSDYVNIEIRYGFNDIESSSPTVRETYVDMLRERWNGQGYDIHRDQATPDGEHYALEARRDDGINLWYRVATGVTLLVQSGCVPKSDPGEIQYLPPAGGPVPGSEWDTIDIDGVQGLPEAPSEEAVSSFSESESPSPAGMVPWNREADPSESGPSPYEGQL